MSENQKPKKASKNNRSTSKGEKKSTHGEKKATKREKETSETKDGKQEIENLSPVEKTPPSVVTFNHPNLETNTTARSGNTAPHPSSSNPEHWCSCQGNLILAVFKFKSGLNLVNYIHLKTQTKFLDLLCYGPS